MLSAPLFKALRAQLLLIIFLMKRRLLLHSQPEMPECRERFLSHAMECHRAISYQLA